jgi:hypothetical protein
MKGPILNSPIRPPKNLQPHHIRHIITGTLVFILGIAANEAIFHLRRHWPRKVRWSANEIQHNYIPPTSLPPTNVQVDIGITEDGSFVWRPQKHSSAEQ